MDEIIIRKAELKDLEQLYIFEQGVIKAERPFDPTLKTERIHYYDLAEMLNAQHTQLVVAELNELIVGSGYGRIQTGKPYQNFAEYLYLGFMYVLPEYRGKGINKMVIENLREWACQKGIHELRLEVYENNIPAIKAYEKIGFVKHMIEMRLDVSKE